MGLVGLVGWGPACGWAPACGWTQRKDVHHGCSVWGWVNKGWEASTPHTLPPTHTCLTAAWTMCHCHACWKKAMVAVVLWVGTQHCCCVWEHGEMLQHLGGPVRRVLLVAPPAVPSCCARCLVLHHDVVDCGCCHQEVVACWQRQGPLAVEGRVDGTLPAVVQRYWLVYFVPLLLLAPVLSVEM